MQIIIGADHAGFDVKQYILNANDFFKTNNLSLDIHDVGTFDNRSCDYPDIATKLVSKLQPLLPPIATEKQNAFGILICGTGIGMCIAANRFRYIRAAVCNDLFTASMSRKHNNANILCMGARIINKQQTLEIIKTFLLENYEGGRHDKRVMMI